MIKKIAHLSDIHIRKVPTRNDEYEKVFDNLFNSLTENQPDRIVVVGDLVHNYLDLQGEQLILASKFLNGLAKIAPVIITRGNHDFRRKNKKRVDSVNAIVKTIDNPQITYYKKTGLYQDNNVIWAVWHHGDDKNNPWKTKQAKHSDAFDFENSTSIDLFHDPINGCKSTTGFEMKKKTYYKISDFKGDYSFLGDIHLKQYFKDRTKAYSGSLIAQDFSEGDEQFHGYLLWDIEKNNVEEIPIFNEYSFKNIKLTPFADFDDLDYEIENPTKHMKVRIVWATLPSTRNKENERKIISYINSKYPDVIISHKNEFVEEDVIEVEEDLTINDIMDQTVQHEIFKNFLDKIGVEEKMINDIIALDDEITKKIEIELTSNIEWSVVKFGGTNFMSYEDIDIDWRDMDGLYQITGINTAGKTTILKLISYALFAKTLETENRKKHGDSRFVNNKNNSDFCDVYLVIEANGEYYGIKRRTDITHNKKGEINGAPTKVSYYLLSSPDDEMTDTNSIDSLTEDDKNKTQKKINEIIGTYDNYMRVVMTTSDTLNRILSNDMATFIDSILYDSGLDIFDKKLTGLKEHQKEENKKQRITCNVEFTEETNKNLEEKKQQLNNEINEIKEVKLPDVQKRIKIGETYIDQLNKKLFKIDPEIANLNVDNTKSSIKEHESEINQLNERKTVLFNGIQPLKETYDEERYNFLLEQKESHKQTEYNKKLEIKAEEAKIAENDHQIEIINGKIHVLKQEGGKKKEEIKELRESKTCPTCGQLVTAEHQTHIDEKIKGIEKEMFEIADKIKQHNTSITGALNIAGEAYYMNIETINEEIKANSLKMEKILVEIGDLTNDKNDVEKRRELQNELDQIPTKIQNEDLKKSILEQNLQNHENSLLQIEENKKIEKGIKASKDKLIILREEETQHNENIINKNNEITQIDVKINENIKLISDYKEQEYQDKVFELYKKCVHREGIPRQLLVNYVIPKINDVLKNVLSITPFKVWLDTEDLRPKLAYYNTPDAIIDAISSSGKERTFASVVLKIALNEINIKSKPTLFLLDEVMGKLTDESVEEFVEILQIIKEKCKKLLIIEHHANIAPDYILEVDKTIKGISSVEIK